MATKTDTAELTRSSPARRGTTPAPEDQDNGPAHLERSVEHGRTMDVRAVQSRQHPLDREQTRSRVHRASDAGTSLGRNPAQRHTDRSVVV